VLSVGPALFASGDVTMVPMRRAHFGLEVDCAATLEEKES
jgi:hypothetical protein